MSDKRHVLTPGRWRVSVTFGRYRIGFHRSGPGAYSWGAGFFTGNVDEHVTPPLDAALQWAATEQAWVDYAYEEAAR